MPQMKNPRKIKLTDIEFSTKQQLTSIARQRKIPRNTLIIEVLQLLVIKQNLPNNTDKYDRAKNHATDVIKNNTALLDELISKYG